MSSSTLCDQAQTIVGMGPSDILVAMPAGDPPISGALPLASMAALEESGFVVIPGPFDVEQLRVAANAYDAEVGAPSEMTFE
jgi:hypothetical protein